MSFQSIAKEIQALADRMTTQRSQSPEDKSAGLRQEKAPECDICGDDAWLAVLDDGTKVPFSKMPYGVPCTTVECECLAKRRMLRMFQSSHISDEFSKLGFQNFTTEGRPQAVVSAYNSAMAYLKAFDTIRADRCNSVALLGDPGCGKTHLLMALCNNLMRKRERVMYFPWVEGMNELKDNLDELDKRVGVMKEVPVLYIDDLYKGRREPTDFSLEQLFGIVNYRYLNHLPTLLSSEKDVDALCRIDEGIGSRLFEMARNHTVLMRLTEDEKAAGMTLNYRLR